MDFAHILWMGHPVWQWGLFMSIVVTLLVLDLCVLHRKSHEVGFRESLITSGFYVLCALAFGGWIYFNLGDMAFKDYLTGYVVEYTLSMDNIFVMSLIFGYLGIPRAYQHRVLFWGIIGVVVLRGVLIVAGAALVARFEWVLYLFAAFLIFSGVKMLLAKHGDAMDVSTNPVLKYLRNHFRITHELHEQKFLVRQPDEKGVMRQYITPLMVALIMVELADVVFAVDSVPAIFAITQDAFIVFTSNLFAILGLRSLYFALSAMVDKFSYLKKALSLILIFIGFKVFLTPVFEHYLGWSKFPSGLSLGVTLGLLAWGVVWSLVRMKHPKTVK